MQRTKYYRGYAVDSEGNERQCCYSPAHTSWQAAESCAQVTVLSGYETVSVREVQLVGRLGGS